MPTFQKCDPSVRKIASEILNQFETHKPLLESRAQIDYVFAFCDRDEKTGLPVNNALSKNGVKALGIAKKISLKERVLGRGDAEISIDGDWWQKANEQEQRALLDHELHHLCPKIDKRGFVCDDIGRPIIQLRAHDYEFGWFKVIASRHEEFSQERIQARSMMTVSGQLFWPDVVAANALTSKGKK